MKTQHIKALFKSKCIAFNPYIGKKEKFQINSPNFHFDSLEKKKQPKS